MQAYLKQNGLESECKIRKYLLEMKEEKQFCTHGRKKKSFRITSLNSTTAIIIFREDSTNPIIGNPWRKVSMRQPGSWAWAANSDMMAICSTFQWLQKKEREGSGVVFSISGPQKKFFKSLNHFAENSEVQGNMQGFLQRIVVSFSTWGK